jgi:hypothetical protein
MSIIEWIIWGVGCVFVVGSAISFLAEVLRIDPFPTGPEGILPLRLRIFDSGLTTVLMATGVITTAITNTSKLHLLWFIPLCFWGITWVVTHGWLAWELFLHWYDNRERNAHQNRFNASSSGKNHIYRDDSYLPDTSQWVLKKRGFSAKFVKGLREVLGDEKFSSFTLLCEKHYLFDQDFFSNPRSFDDINDDMTNLHVATFLTSVANDLCKRHILDDGEKLSQIVLTIRPKHLGAHATLALIYFETGRLSLAREHARKALSGMDSLVKEFKDASIPADVVNLRDPGFQHTHNLLKSISDFPKDVEEVIDGLDEILKHLFKILLVRYRTAFPEDQSHTIALRASVVLNELVVEDLRGDQVEFRRNNPEFVDREKKEVMLLREVKKGVLDFLVAKGGYYRSLVRPGADIWISEAKKIDARISIPNTLEEVRELIDSCLNWYQQHS